MSDRARAILACACSLVFVAGCVSSRRGSAGAVRPGAVAQSSVVSPVPPRFAAGPEPAVDPDPASGPRSARPPAVLAGPVAPPLDAAAGDLPGWWLVAPDRQSGRVRVTARAFAPDVRAARRESVAAGRASLAEALGIGLEELTDDRVEFACVKARRGAAASERFVGYALVSKDSPAAD